MPPQKRCAQGKGKSLPSCFPPGTNSPSESNPQIPIISFDWKFKIPESERSFDAFMFFKNNKCTTVHHMHTKFRASCYNDFSRNVLFCDKEKVQNILSFVSDIQVYGFDQEIASDLIVKFKDLSKKKNCGSTTCRTVIESYSSSSINMKDKIHFNNDWNNTNSINNKIFRLIENFGISKTISSFLSYQRVSKLMTVLNNVQARDYIIKAFEADIIICDCLQKCANKFAGKKICTGHILRFIRYIVCFSLFCDSNRLFSLCKEIEITFDFIKGDVYNFRPFLISRIDMISSKIMSKFKATPVGNPIVFTKEEFADCHFF